MNGYHYFIIIHGSDLYIFLTKKILMVTYNGYLKVRSPAFSNHGNELCGTYDFFTINFKDFTHASLGIKSVMHMIGI